VQAGQQGAGGPAGRRQEKKQLHVVCAQT
jgi:hypothetical protein